MGFTLRILKGPDRGREYKFDRIQVTIGRTMDNDVVVPDPGISRRHLSIRDKGGAYIIKDLDSSNGTQVNGRRVREEVLRPGDVIGVGEVQIRFEGPAGSSVESRRASNVRAPAPRRQAPSAASRPAARRGASAQRKPTARAAGRRPSARNRAAPSRAGKARGADADHSQKSGSLIRSSGLRRRESEPAENAGRAGGADGVAARRGRGRGQMAADQPAAKGPALWIQRVKVWFLSLDKKKRIAVASAAGLALVLLFALALGGGEKLGIVGLPWCDDEVLKPGQRVGNGPAWYGLEYANKCRCAWRAAFEFRYANGRVVMTYMVGGIDSKAEVVIKLNGMDLTAAPITMDDFSDVNVFDLPRKNLLDNQINKVEFINLLNRDKPDSMEEWGVAVDSIVEHPLPPPDEKKAQETFTNAMERFKNQGVAPGNLFLAMRFYAQARDYLELLHEDQRPEIYIEAVEQIDKIDDQLNKLFRDRMFQAEQALEYKKIDEALNVYRLLMLTFPDEEDWRHQRARAQYQRWGGSLQQLKL